MPKFDASTDRYGWDASEAELSQVRGRCMLLAAANLVLSVLCGVAHTGVTRDNGVGFAATAALVALMVEIIGTVRFQITEPQLPRQAFRSIHRMMTWAPLYHMILMGVAALCALIFCIRAFTGWLDLAVLLGFLLMGACSFFLRRAYQSVRTYQTKELE